jgi:hypothetical protein
LDFFLEIRSTLISNVLSIFLQAEIFGVKRSLNVHIEVAKKDAGNSDKEMPTDTYLGHA